MPCQWTSSGVSVSLKTSTVMGLPSLHAEDGAGGCAVVADGGEDAVGGEFDGDGGDAEGVVGFAVPGDVRLLGTASGQTSGRAGVSLRLWARARLPSRRKSRRCTVS